MRYKRIWLCGMIIVFCVTGLLLGNTINRWAVTAASIYTWGSSGDTVRVIQERLKRSGYYNGSADGLYGYRTFEAVKYFQRKNGIREDGIAGSQTMEALGIFESGEASNRGTRSLSLQTADSTSNEKENTVWLLAGVIDAEAGAETYPGQVAVGAVVLNRVEHPSFPNTIAGVIYQPGAFAGLKVREATPSETAIKAARDALNGWDPSNGALYFWNPGTTADRWALSLPVTAVIGNHSFGKN